MLVPCAGRRECRSLVEPGRVCGYCLRAQRRRERRSAARAGRPPASAPEGKAETFGRRFKPGERLISPKLGERDAQA